jgi:glucose/mannose-6-phosphate isomerase
MHNIIFNLPEQIKDASQIPIKIKKPRGIDYRNIVIAGMGGSGIGGDILRSLLLPSLKIPVITIKDYRLPGFVTKNTLFLAVSYSGNTEETLEAFNSARQIGCHIIAITSGGMLSIYCEKYKIDCIEIPSGISSRCAIGYLFIPQLLSLSKLGLIRHMDQDIEETVKTLTHNRKKYENFARVFAPKLSERLPLVYSTSPLFVPVATRWQTQFNENAEIISHTNVLPELDHNEIMGMSDINPLFPLYYLFLIDPNSHSRNLLRVKLTLEIMKSRFLRTPQQKYFEYRKFLPDGKSDLARIFSLIMQGDLTSLYLAHIRGVAPETITAIDELKKKLNNKNKRKG